MRDISKLHPTLQVKVELLKRLCHGNGLEIGISECVRTVAEQDALYAKGRTTSGAKVTNAKGSSYSSMHQWGVAFDIYRNDGKGSYYNNSDGFFDKVGKIGKSIGLEWGGDWKSIKDKPHFQLPDWGSTTNKLKKQFKVPEEFFKTFVAKYNVGYNSHIQSIGWQGEKYNGETSGTVGQGLRIEAITIFSGDVKITAQAQVQDIGWQPEVTDNVVTVGTTGKSRRLETIKLSLDGSNRTIKYRTHIQDIGWSNWSKNGEPSGTIGQSKRIEAIEIIIE